MVLCLHSSHMILSMMPKERLPNSTGRRWGRSLSAWSMPRIGKESLMSKEKKVEDDPTKEMILSPEKSLTATKEIRERGILGTGEMGTETGLEETVMENEDPWNALNVMERGICQRIVLKARLRWHHPAKRFSKHLKKTAITDDEETHYLLYSLHKILPFIFYFAS